MKNIFKRGLFLLLLQVIHLSSTKAQSIQVDSAKKKVSANAINDFPVPSFKSIVIGKDVNLSVGGQFREVYQFY